MFPQCFPSPPGTGLNVTLTIQIPGSHISSLKGQRNWSLDMSLQDLSGQDRLRCFSSTLDRHTHTARKRVPVCHIAHDNL